MFLRIIYSFFIFLLFSVSVLYGKTDEKKADMLLAQSVAESDLPKRELILRKAHKLNPNDSKIHFALGKLLYTIGKEKEAKELLIKAYKDEKLTYRVFTYLADYLYRKGKTLEATLYLKKLISLFKDGNTYLNNFRLAELSVKLGRHREATYFFLKAYDLRKHKDNKEILLELASNHFILKEYKKALFYLKNYPYTNKYNQAALKLLIKTYYHLGSKDNFERVLIKYLDIWPKDLWARKFLSN